MKFEPNNSQDIENSSKRLNGLLVYQGRARIHSDYQCGCELDERALLATEPAEPSPVKECNCTMVSEGVMQVGHC